MQLHTERAQELIRDACRIDEQHRPLIVAGGPKAIYEPWDFFSVNPEDPWTADVAVTGEAYVLLALLERLLTIRSPRESLRTTFRRARNSGILEDIPGLVYPASQYRGVASELLDTGVQAARRGPRRVGPPDLRLQPDRAAVVGEDARGQAVHAAADPPV